MRRALSAAALILLFAVSPSFAESFGVYMIGANETPAGDADGVGIADLILRGTTLQYSVVVYNIEAPTAIHIHPGKRGATGAPLIPIATPWTRVAGCPGPGTPPCAERFVNLGQVEISATNAEALLTRPSDFYLNVHNIPHGPGAVRGQVQFARYLPNVGQTPGAAGSTWFTRFSVLNRSVDIPSQWSIELIPQSPNGNVSRFAAAQTAANPLTLYASSAFPVPSFAGIGTARVLSDQPLAVTAAVYNGAVGARGDFGFSSDGIALENARSSGLLIDLTTSSAADVQARTGHRSNIGFFNPQFFPVEATFRAVGSNGATLGERLITIPPGAMSQAAVFDLISTVAEADRVRDSFWVSWTASAPIFVYATVVNNQTGDPELRE
ncbi:MAG TPA: CHRD domain-containing protein [Thermoanaerobaculia bacterium]|nr:CHRD domain-containing protein [Thermoanaerobaculia bacterium]